MSLKVKCYENYDCEVGVTIPGIQRDNNCFVDLYGKTKPSFAAHSPPLRVGLHFANSGFIFP